MCSCSARIGRTARRSTWPSTASPHGCWTRSGRPTGAATSILWVVLARSRRSVPSELDKLGLLVLLLLFGAGMRLTPAVSADSELTLESAQALPGGSVEIVYACS